MPLAHVLLDLEDAVQLVLINISDHFMRYRMSGDEEMPKVIGCLLGEQTGRHVDVSNSFEMLLRGTPDSPDFDKAVYTSKLEQYAECYKNLHVLGWYSTGGTVGSTELLLHKKFIEHSEVQAPIFVVMDPARVMVPSAKELPLDMFESGAAHVRACFPTALSASVLSTFLPTTQVDSVSLSEVCQTSV